MITLSRRGLIGSLLAAPAIIQLDRLMLLPPPKRLLRHWQIYAKVTFDIESVVHDELTHQSKMVFVARYKTLIRTLTVEAMIPCSPVAA